MFKKVVSHPGFWRSAVFLGAVYAVVLFLIQWGATGFAAGFFLSASLFKFILILFAAGFICGFMVSYGKFWAKLKQKDLRK